MSISEEALRILACPQTGEPLVRGEHALVNRSGTATYRISQAGIPVFAEQSLGGDARRQQAHYDRIAQAYVDNLDYPHTQEYTRFLDQALLAEFGPGGIGRAVEVCCGRGEAFRLLGSRVAIGLGVDVSERMLEHAKEDLPQFAFVQGDATRLPVAAGSVDAVVMLGGIHHVNDRDGLFREVYRVLRPGGRFYFREPLNDFFLWRALRAVIYRVSPGLDHLTERPLTTRETVPPLERAGFRVRTWRSLGFLGFCFFMNSDVLVFNRLFRFVPGIRTVTRLAARFDDWVLRFGPLKGAGLQVIGVAEKAAGAP
jgi:ubiquinone/menaquinone biosynthesis C-methylase UbiE